ncbi:unnamed protein product [Musa acuminata subsp. malaccensis]|uniref:(wild Malaysian banana) hypothetical protein n=1 Tax=Musa acuminata subsp. malaccensis TaxID=214687 RepID=A0A804ICQ6_MUSAM|nr:PREDICTED: uncharacterized protein At4g33100 [Musa acuminata subsp. malaccensis]CAG1850315.1 unnamed protein product [Musa acuminata subsp. malaccensis]
MGSNKTSRGGGATASPCARLRDAYHDCFNRWYSEKFSKGQWDKEECVAEWDKYRACLAQHLEDKHLRRILLETEASPYFVKNDASSPADRDGTTHQ